MIYLLFFRLRLNHIFDLLLQFFFEDVDLGSVLSGLLLQLKLVDSHLLIQNLLIDIPPDLFESLSLLSCESLAHDLQSTGLDFIL